MKTYTAIKVLCVMIFLFFITTNLVIAQIHYNNDSNAYTGIGTLTPNAKLTVVQEDSVTNDITYPFSLRHMAIGTAAPNIGTGIAFEAENNMGNSARFARIRAIMIDNTIDTVDSYLAFDVTQNNQYIEGMRISNNGYVGIGAVNPTYKLHVLGTAYATGAAGALSDRRHKKNINDLSITALKVVKNLRPVTFEWKEPQDSGMEGTQLGFIAQEIEEILPQAILTQDNEEQTKGLKYNSLIPVLTKAIQELEIQNEALETKLRAQSEEMELLISHLLKRIEVLERR